MPRRPSHELPCCPGRAGLPDGATGASRPGSRRPWQFGNLEQAYCITFLVSPEDAPGVLPEDAQPVRLDAMSDATAGAGARPRGSARVCARGCLPRSASTGSAAPMSQVASLWRRPASEMIGVVAYRRAGRGGPAGQRAVRSAWCSPTTSGSRRSPTRRWSRSARSRPPSARRRTATTSGMSSSSGRPG